MSWNLNKAGIPCHSLSGENACCLGPWLAKPGAEVALEVEDLRLPVLFLPYPFYFHYVKERA